MACRGNLGKRWSPEDNWQARQFKVVLAVRVGLCYKPAGARKYPESPMTHQRAAAALHVIYEEFFPRRAIDAPPSVYICRGGSLFIGRRFFLGRQFSDYQAGN